jgi:uncharacterized oxidoreductase
MKLTGNTILINGGGSGIGRGLAEAFQALGNTVIIAGRRRQALEETTAANPGMRSAQLDIESAPAIRTFITTNLLGPIRLTAALLPQQKKQQAATIMTVSSGLAYLPMAMTPTYSRPRRRSIRTR